MARAPPDINPFPLTDPCRFPHVRGAETAQANFRWSTWRVSSASFFFW